MRKLLFGLVFITTFMIALPFKGYCADAVNEEIKLYVGQSQVISVSSPKRVAIGNPAIADVTDILLDNLNPALETVNGLTYEQIKQAMADREV